MPVPRTGPPFGGVSLYRIAPLRQRVTVHALPAPRMGRLARCADAWGSMCGVHHGPRRRSGRGTLAVEDGGVDPAAGAMWCPDFVRRWGLQPPPAEKYESGSFPRDLD